MAGNPGFQGGMTPNFNRRGGRRHRRRYNRNNRGSCGRRRTRNPLERQLNRKMRSFGSGKVSGASDLDPEKLKEAAIEGANKEVVKAIRKQAFANGARSGDRFFRQNLMPNLREENRNEKYGTRTDNSERDNVGEHLLATAAGARRGLPSFEKKRMARELAKLANRAIKKGAF